MILPKNRFAMLSLFLLLIVLDSSFVIANFIGSTLYPLVEHFHPPEGYQPVKGFEPVNYQPNRNRLFVKVKDGTLRSTNPYISNQASFQSQFPYSSHPLLFNYQTTATMGSYQTNSYNNNNNNNNTPYLNPFNTQQPSQSSVPYYNQQTTNFQNSFQPSTNMEQFSMNKFSVENQFTNNQFPNQMNLNNGPQLNQQQNHDQNYNNFNNNNNNFNQIQTNQPFFSQNNFKSDISSSMRPTLPNVYISPTVSNLNSETSWRRTPPPDKIFTSSIGNGWTQSTSVAINNNQNNNNFNMNNNFNQNGFTNQNQFNNNQNGFNWQQTAAPQPMSPTHQPPPPPPPHQFPSHPTLPPMQTSMQTSTASSVFFTHQPPFQTTQDYNNQFKNNNNNNWQVTQQQTNFNNQNSFNNNNNNNFQQQTTQNFNNNNFQQNNNFGFTTSQNFNNNWNNNWNPITTTAPTTTTPASSTSVDYKQLFINSKKETTTENHVGNFNNAQLAVDDNCMKCLCFIESWCSDVGCVMDQGSLSCGWYQLKYEYWVDCGQPGGGWKECANNKRCAEQCVRRYMNRYGSFCSVGNTCADLARIHNGGPYGCSSNTTEYYGWLIARCLRREAPYEKIDTFPIPN